MLLASKSSKHCARHDFHLCLSRSAQSFPTSPVLLASEDQASLNMTRVGGDADIRHPKERAMSSISRQLHF
jgi:hypothetical protein